MTSSHVRVAGEATRKAVGTGKRRPVGLAAFLPQYWLPVTYVLGLTILET
jgi:hypothetical protein